MNYTCVLGLGLLALAGGALATGGCGAETTVATFNTALSPFFIGNSGDSEIEERTSILIEELERSDVDIFCLQEVFFADIQRQIYRSLRDKYPYVFTATNLTIKDNNSFTVMACTRRAIQDYENCLATECPGLQELKLYACSLRCLVLVTPKECQICIRWFHATPRDCRSLPAFRFERNYGLMLLSRKRLRNTRASGFNNQSQFRGYLEASVKGVGHLVCTHLSSFLPVYIGPPVVSPPLYTNYDEQQYDEVLTLFEAIANKDTPILLGDFNNGPASPGNTWELPFHYGLINARGLVSPYVLEDGRCTFCTDNPAVALAGFPFDVLVDHVYLTTDAFKKRVTSSMRFLDDNEVTASGSPLSDHYGVRVTLKDTRSYCQRWERSRFYCLNTPRPGLLPLPAPQAELSRLCVASN